MATILWCKLVSLAPPSSAGLVAVRGCGWGACCCHPLKSGKLLVRFARRPLRDPKQRSESLRRFTDFRKGETDTVVRAVQKDDMDDQWNREAYQALMRGGEEVTSVMEEMRELLEDIAMDAEAEDTAVQIAATGAVGHRIEKLDGTFLLALDWMIKQADSEHDEKRKWLLELLKDTVLDQLTQKCPAHVQVVGMLCNTPSKEHRVEILRRVAGGGGTFDTESGGKLSLPHANLNDIASQADDILSSMEEKSGVPDQKLLARLVLVREEARGMMGGGILDKRNDNRGLTSLPEKEVNFLSKIVGLRPGPALRERLSSAMHGKEEGEDMLEEGIIGESNRSHGNSKVQKTGKSTVLSTIRPGIFLETVTKVLSSMYESNTAGVSVQQLEWIHRETLKILQEMAFS